MPPRDQTHRVCLSFEFRDGWQCQFLEADLQTPLPKRLHFVSSSKIFELVERAGRFTDQETRLIADQGIKVGRGGLFLQLTEEPCAKLRKQ